MEAMMFSCIFFDESTYVVTWNRRWSHFKLYNTNY